MPTLKEVVNYRYASKFKNPDVTTILKKGSKGVSLFARKNINKGDIIAYYRFKVYNSNHVCYNDYMYAMTVYTKTGREYSKFIGDIFSGSLRKPEKGVSFWAYFSNEPSNPQKANCYLDELPERNFKRRKTVKLGDILVYGLIATKNIQKGEEIVWCYGGAYNRNYKANCPID